MKASDLNSLTIAFMRVDLSEGELILTKTVLGEAYQLFATALYTHANNDVTKLGIEKEISRLVKMAKDALAHDQYVAEHVDPKNVWSAVRNNLRLMLAKKIVPSLKVKVKAGKDAKGNVITVNTPVSQLPNNPRGLSDNNAILKKAINPTNTDKRVDNKPKAKRAPQQPSSAPQQHSNSITAKDWTTSMTFALKQVKTAKLLIAGIVHHKVKIIEIAKSMGYDITVTPVKK